MAPSCAAVSMFAGANCADVLHVCAALRRSADDAPTASNLSSKDRASGSSAPLPVRFDTRPQHGSTRTGCRPLPRSDEVPPEILHSSREPEMEREPSKRGAGLGRLPTPDLGRQDKARKVRAVGCGWVERRISAITQTLCSIRRNLRVLAKCYYRSAFDTL
jgi:hypothetical protein